ncbi:MAG: hypothetical protein EBU08_11990 [Micrococcales bacterium]|nr:hypothetical protein [Micrococcales bacterium]
MTNQYTRPGSATVPIAVNNVVLITTPEGTVHASNCGCGACSGGGAVTGAQGTQGVRGAQGTQGVQGTIGLQGVQGVQGRLGTGTQGTQGTAGLQGISGAALDNTDDLTEGTTNKYFTVARVSYAHMQGAASNSWAITHNLGFKPNVTVIDSAGNIVEGEIAYTNSNSLTVSFQSAFSGNAYLS